MKKVIILLQSDNLECWGSLTEICKHHKEFSYQYLKSKSFPFVYKGVQFFKVNYREVNISQWLKKE